MANVPITDEEKRACLRDGKPLIFDPGLPDAVRTIQAAWLVELIQGHERVVRVPIHLENAIVEGALDMSGVTFECDVVITGLVQEQRKAQFRGSVDFSFAIFKRAARFDCCRFKAFVNFRAAEALRDFEIDDAQFAEDAVFQDLHVAESLICRRASFAGADFQRIEAGKAAFYNQTTFSSEARFLGAHIKGQAGFNGAQFEGTKKAASFDGAHIDGQVFFGPATGAEDKLIPVCFKGEARFHGVRIKGQADFSGAQFEGPKKAASFDGAQLEGGAFFGAATSLDGKPVPVRFIGHARFPGAHIKVNAEFGSAQFEGGPIAASFDGAQIEGDAFFRPATGPDGGHLLDANGKAIPVHFKGEARFLGVQVGGNAEFDGAQFDGKEKAASFDGAHIDGGAFFDPTTGPDGNEMPVHFAGACNFPAAVFASEARFSEAQFAGGADFENTHFLGGAKFGGADFAAEHDASFTGARFERGLSFDKAVFSGPVSFDNAIADREAYFQGTVFAKSVTFREAHFHTLFFRATTTNDLPKDSPKQFVGPVDAVGFTYDRIRVACRELLSKQDPYDRQPYTQIESAIRATGDDRTADDIHYARRCREGDRLWNRVRRRNDAKGLSGRDAFASFPTALLDSLYRHVVRYGVRPYRLAVLTLLILAVGTFIMSWPGAVISVEKDMRASDPASLSLWQATGVSVNEFLPVPIPSGSRWTPTEKPLPYIGSLGMRFTTYVSIHRIAGWILVPLGVAALTGLLHRRQSPGSALHI